MVTPEEVKECYLAVKLHFSSNTYHYGKFKGKVKKDNFSDIHLYFENNVMARISVSWLNPEKEQKLVVIGEKGMMLKEDLEVTINFYNDSPLNINLPNQIACKIVSTDAALKGQTVSSSYKPAKLENGLNIQVPPFIENEDSIIIDTRTLEYIKKL